jgi:hypothetical protein
MRNIWTLAFAITLAWHAPVIAQTSPTPKIIDNPEKLAADVVQMIANGASNDAAITITEAMAQPAVLLTFQNALKVFDDKKFNFSKKVVDNEVGGALRQIINYSYVEKLGFVYFRFNFKMTSKGWILASFFFKSETNELFPKDWPG